MKSNRREKLHIDWRNKLFSVKTSLPFGAPPFTFVFVFMMLIFFAAYLP